MPVGELSRLVALRYQAEKSNRTGQATRPADSCETGGTFHNCKEAQMRRMNWNAALQSLVLVRLGQDLGHDSKLARAIHNLIDLLVNVATGIF